MKILLPIDGGPSSTRAAKYVARHARLFGKRPGLVLVHVDSALIERISAQVGPDDLARFHAKNSNAALRAAVRILRAAGMPFRERRLVGDPSAEIARAAREERCDLIVMGSHGRGALKSLLLGSVATKTLARTRIPVLIVR